MLKQTLITAITLPVLFTGIATPAFADSPSDFGSCLNPQVNASQVNVGTNHGVAGSTETYAGTDSIYRLSNGNVTQCLCRDNGKGIQTNWLKTTGMSEKDIEVLRKQGWIYIVTGSNWGLSDVPYLAKNIEYTCKSGTPTATPTCTPTPTGTVTPTPTKAVTPTPQVQSKVVTLASTGNTVAVAGLVIAGVFSLLAGLLLKKFSK